jgi:hypothetical protein
MEHQSNDGSLAGTGAQNVSVGGSLGIGSVSSASAPDEFSLVSSQVLGQSEIFVPVSIFTNGASGLESISKYLKESLGMKYCMIAELMNRDDRTIWNACTEASRKAPQFTAEDASVKIPVSIFQDRSLSVLEAIAEYLKEALDMRYCDIAALLGKNQRTVWTVYSRAKKKRNSNAN